MPNFEIRPEDGFTMPDHEDEEPIVKHVVKEKGKPDLRFFGGLIDFGLGLGREVVNYTMANMPDVLPFVTRSRYNDSLVTLVELDDAFQDLARAYKGIQVTERFVESIGISKISLAETDMDTHTACEFVIHINDARAMQAWATMGYCFHRIEEDESEYDEEGYLKQSFQDDPMGLGRIDPADYGSGINDAADELEGDGC
jgi:hypothetical protein